MIDINNYKIAFSLGLRYSSGDKSDIKKINLSLSKKPFTQIEELFFNKGCDGTISFLEATTEIIPQSNKDKVNIINNKLKIK